jgi:hypothetical protein
MSTIILKGNDIPEKIELAELERLIKTTYPRARVSHRDWQHVTSPSVTGQYGEGVIIPAQIVIDELPDDADEKTIAAIVKEHKPEKGDRDIRLEAQAARLFDVLINDPRMKKLLELVGPK